MVNADVVFSTMGVCFDFSTRALDRVMSTAMAKPSELGACHHEFLILLLSIS